MQGKQYRVLLSLIQDIMVFKIFNIILVWIALSFFLPTTSFAQRKKKPNPNESKSSFYEPSYTTLFGGVALTTLVAPLMLSATHDDISYGEGFAITGSSNLSWLFFGASFFLLYEATELIFDTGWRSEFGQMLTLVVGGFALLAISPLASGWAMQETDNLIGKKIQRSWTPPLAVFAGIWIGMGTTGLIVNLVGEDVDVFKLVLGLVALNMATSTLAYTLYRPKLDQPLVMSLPVVTF